MQNSLLQRGIAEGIGTFALTFVGILSITNGGQAGLVGIALAHGLTIFVMVAATGGISGAHINPAVTFGFVATGRMPVREGLAYWASQLSGGLVAAGILFSIIGAELVATGTPQLHPDVSFGAGVALEAVATFFLVFVIFGSAVDKRAPKNIFPLAIGLTVALDILAIGPLTGAAMNPARVLGGAIVSGMWENHLLYWIGPLLGGLLGAMAMHFIFIKGDDS